MPTDSFKVGITGGIGSGKSLICKIFHSLGVPVYDADSRTRMLMQRDKTLAEAIQHTFGTQTYRNGELQRSHLAQLVFGNPEMLAKLNALVHPRVEEDFCRWAKEQNSTYVLKEAALLIEAGSYKQLDCLVLITAPLELRKQRIRLRDPQRSETEITDVMARQLSDEQKLPFAQHVLINDGRSPILGQVLALHAAFLERRCS